MVNLKDEFIETMEIFFDVVALNVLFYLITLTSFSLLLLPTLFIFANGVFRFHKKSSRSLLGDLKEITKRDFYAILKHDAIQWFTFVCVVLFSRSITVTLVFTAVIFPFLITFWYLLINRNLGFFEYYKVTLLVLLSRPLLYFFIVLTSILTTYVVYFMNGFFLIVFLPVGLVYLQLFAVDKVVMKLGVQNANSEI